MKKYILGIGIVLVLAAVVLFQRFGTTPADTYVATTDTGLGSNVNQPSVPGSVPDQSPATSGSGTVPDPQPSVTPTTSGTANSQTGAYRDGTYTGSVADAFYGNLQVAATIANGRLSDVQFVQYPNDQLESVQVNSRAMPMLKSEAISSQSANVNTVSGATQSSDAFRQSLAAALSQARS
jgi:uncharacterized protein with FMN-binding domain